MVTLTLDWREVLWWMQGGMSGSHLMWGVYEDMVNKVWPQCSEQERRNLWLVMRRDLGYYWRPDGWRGRNEDFDSTGDGPWKKPVDYEDPEWNNKDCITDITPWTRFRQVLARFNPENQYAVTIKAETDEEVEGAIGGLSLPYRISTPTLILSADRTRYCWDMSTPVTVRAYGWKDLNGNDAYFIDWRRRVDPDRVIKAERLDIPDDGTM